jgi:hypothetical protein
MGCNPISDLTGCLGSAVGGQGNLANAPGWNAICQSFAKAAQQLLGTFAKSFVATPSVSLTLSSVRSVYGMSLEIAAVLAALLLMAQVIRTVLTHDGSALAQGLIGVAKAALAFVLTLAVAATALRAADELTRWIIARSFGSPLALSAHLARLTSFGPSVPGSLTFMLALLGMVLTIALWAQLLARNVAVTVLVAVAPIAAAGQVAHGTQQWWRKLARATAQLIVLKPVVALIFAVGLRMPSLSGTVERLLAGMLVLLLAGCAWPAMARAAGVLDVHVSGGTLGRGRGAAGRSTSAGEQPGGVDPAVLSRVAEAKTMAVVHEAYPSAVMPWPELGGPSRVRLPDQAQADQPETDRAETDQRSADYELTAADYELTAEAKR